MYISVALWIINVYFGYNPTLLYLLYFLNGHFGQLFQLATMSLWHSSIFFLLFLELLLSGTKRCSGITDAPVYSLPQSLNQPFLQGALVPFMGEWY